MLTPFQIPRFGGLDLSREPEEIGLDGAIDLLNVDFDNNGAVRVRDGTVAFNATAGADAFTTRPSVWSGGGLVVVYNGTDLKAYNAAGALQSSLTVSVSPSLTTAALGTSAAGPYLYVGGGEATAIRRLNTSATWSSPAGMPNARYLAVQSPDNRLVAAYTASGEQSRVKFSDAGAPETWTASSFVDLYPNDGEVITGMASYGGMLYVFKQTKVFQFWGNSTDADGNAVFNVRCVDHHTGAMGGTPVAGPDGVYFVSEYGGVFRTRGGPAERISSALHPLFKAQTPTFYAGPTLTPSWASFSTAVCGDQLLCARLSTGYIFAYRFSTGEWTLWDVGSSAVRLSSTPMQNFNNNNAESFLYSNGTTRMIVSSPGTTTDYTGAASTAIVSRYRSGFFSPVGSPSQECTIRESVLEGIGTPSFSVSRDFGAVPATGGGAKAAVTLGTSPAYAQGRHRVAQRGRRFSYQIEASSGAWRVNSITHHVRGVRPPGLKTT